MSSIIQRLESLGFLLPPSPQPQGSYAPATRVGNLAYVAGQLPMRDGRIHYKGKVGRDVNTEQAREAACLSFLNALAALGSIGLSLDRVTRVVRLGGFIQCVEGFSELPLVMNGASDLAQALFGARGLPVRT